MNDMRTTLAQLDENKGSVNRHFGKLPGLNYPHQMTLSARNQLAGTVEEVQLGGVMAHVVVRVGENLIESVITRRSAEAMSLKKGDAVKVVIKSTEVMLQKD
jgi:molybdopterin-binding protein